MANDREVLKVMWEGKIPVKFITEDDHDDQDSYFLMVPRVSYFPLVTDKVKKHFQRYIENEENEVWLSYNEIPLKWHFPIGLLFDLLATDDSLPWQIKVNFKKFPEDVLFKCSNKDVVESHFMSCLKEADALKHKGQVISQMQKKDHKTLFLGLLNDKFDQFWAVNRRLMESAEQEGFKHIPLRCYSDDGSSTYIQKLIVPITETGQKKTLQDLLSEFSTPARKAVGAKSHGIEIPIDTELQWLSETLSYPDNFLHLVLIYE
ncbi:CLUMA_CG011363, isoform A [Clunio marinus]|uniref:Autophagy protein 5 n=1 Tax=Clunio marinus TaxID=568069 RepID=A0A1J1IDZ9_9DIPT|nr:CLUMA_CG011363, isoform A [Clunio marinus]